MKIYRSALLLSVGALLVWQCKNAPEESAKTTNINALLTEIKAYQTEINPQDSLHAGHHLRGDFSAPTIAHFSEQQEKYTALIAQLDAFIPATKDEEISQEILRYKLENTLDFYTYQRYFLPLNAEGGFYNEINFALPNLPFHSVQDYRDFMSWMPQYAQYLRDNQALLKLGIAEGIVLPKVLANNTLDLLQPWLREAGENHPFWQPFSHMPDSISAENQAELKAAMAAILEAEIYPAYAELYQFMATEYLPACTEEIGVSAQKNGVAFYENRVQHFTTLPISADSVFNLGMAEVARIKHEMERVKTVAGFSGTVAEYIQFLRTDAQFYAKTPEELLHFGAWLSKKAEGKLPQYFAKLYRNPFTVKPVAAAIAPNYTAGRYSGGSLAQHRAGEYWVNTYDLPARPLYALPALTLHEAVPGHHLHNALTEELDSLPDFRRHFYISAFGEGWGLYSEYLGEEMGMYTTPAEWFGRYTYEMWRACRLVVDVGIHKKGWRRQQAVDFLAENTALSMREVNTEIDRYIGWPGQALSYKMGELKIKQLRATAEKELGSDFDLRTFHNALLSQGSLTLPLLDALISEWIIAQQNQEN